MSERPRRIVILAYQGVQSLDVTGPLEVFHAASELLAATRPQEPGYRVEILAPEPGPLQSSSGLGILPEGDLGSARGPVDTLIVPGGSGKDELARDRLTIDWIRATSGRARRTAGVCTGSFLLAEAGLLDGRRATTHWAFSESLARRHPRVEVDPEPIFVRDGEIWTSAGVTAGMDLALALVEEDHDRELALTIARHLVLFLRRPGNQSQFSATLVAQEPRREPLRETQRYVLEHVADEHSVEAMAARAHMSPRNFARAFRAETGVTPARYVERVRLEAARRRLEESSEPVALVARACGFGRAESMRRTFLRTLEVGPAEYRRRFQHHAAA
ncbi:MAG TPA: GlxA family transcriptional regulator [Solirubrobacteraceae bacterium]